MLDLTLNDHELADKLATEFSRVLGTWLTASEMSEVRKRNATPEYGNGICASHDFCDANMAMLEAFEKTVGREPDLNTQRDLDLWGIAWSLAKKREFRP